MDALFLREIKYFSPHLRGVKGIFPRCFPKVFPQDPSPQCFSQYRRRRRKVFMRFPCCGRWHVRVLICNSSAVLTAERGAPCIETCCDCTPTGYNPRSSYGNGDLATDLMIDASSRDEANEPRHRKRPSPSRLTFFRRLVV